LIANIDGILMSKVSCKIAEQMGLHFPEERWPDLARGLKAAGSDMGFEDANDCAGWLTSQELTIRQIETLASHLTVGETCFFRDPASFAGLENHILASLVARRAEAGRTIRLWSAGCCTGEEAYSLAIACNRIVPNISDWNVSILATDINPRFLSKAEAGIYSDWSFRGTPGWVRERFFSPRPGRKFSIDPAIKRLVHFGYLNLALDVYPSLFNQTNAMDVIFCRNVLMYFTPEHQRKVVAALHNCLLDGGHLVVNLAEASASLFPMFTMENIGGVIFCRKTENPAIAESLPSFVEPAPLPAVLTAEPSFFIGQRLPAPDAASACEAPCEPQLSFETDANAFLKKSREKAEAKRTNIAQVKPDNASEPLSLARIYANEGRLHEALTCCQQVISAERTNATAHFLCATICHELGLIEEAIAAFGRVLYLDQDFILAHHALSGLYKQLGKQKKSMRHLGIALDLLSKRSKDEILPESDGITCGRLVESIRAVKGE
jgi:chemotaxis protein methyltransferase CheR